MQQQQQQQKIMKISEINFNFIHIPFLKSNLSILIYSTAKEREKKKNFWKLVAQATRSIYTFTLVHAIRSRLDIIFNNYEGGFEVHINIDLSCRLTDRPQTPIMK